MSYRPVMTPAYRRGSHFASRRERARVSCSSSPVVSARPAEAPRAAAFVEEQSRPALTGSSSWKFAILGTRGIAKALARLLAIAGKPDLHGGVKTERDVSCRQVVVDRLRDSDDRHALLREAVRDAEGVVAPDGDENVDVVLLQRLSDGLDAASGSEGIRSPQADGIIAVLIAAVSSPAGEPPKGHLVQGREGGAHGCPYCPHPPPYVTTAPASIASDGLGVSYSLRSAGAPSGNAAPATQLEPTGQEYPNLPRSSNEHGRHAGEPDHAVAGS